MEAKGRVSSVIVTLQLDTQQVETIEAHYTSRPLDEAGLRGFKELLGHQVVLAAARALRLDDEILAEQRAASEARIKKWSNQGEPDGQTGA